MQWYFVVYVVLLLLLSHNLKGIKTVVEVYICSIVIEVLYYYSLIAVLVHDGREEY